MAFTPQEQSIIDFGVKNGKSQQEVQQALVNFRMGKTTQPTVQAQPEQKQSLFSPITTEFGGGEQGIAMKLKRDIQGGADAYQQSLQGTKNPLVAGANLALAGGRVAGDVAGAVFTPVATGLNAATGGYLGKIFDAVGKISQMGGKYNPLNAITDLTAVQDFVAKNPQLEEDFGRALNIALASAETGKIEPSTVIPRTLEQFKNAGEGISNAANIVDTKVKELGAKTQEKIAGITQDTPSNIMNRVARLKPTDEVNFTKLSNGKTPGEYLTETGNFGTPDKVISTEASKFKASMDSVDAELAKLPGVYKDGSITDALTGLLKKSQEVSGANVKAPYYQQVLDLIAKYNSEGLTMDEINTVKRLYERNVKLGYNKLTNGTQVEQATNIDSALRNWQIKQANDLGFKNIYDLNKQTQLSKFLVNKLGDRVIGQAGLNGVSLTDWIVLSGGDVSNIAGFLTKKFFSDPGVQAKIAEIINKLNNGEVKGLIKPETTITPANIERRASPQGLKQLNAPAEGAPQSSINTPINQPSARAINSGTEIVPKPIRETQTPQQPVKKVSVSSPNPTTPKPTVKPVINSESSLLQEAKKYKSAEEFVKKFELQKVYHGSKVSDVIEKEGFKIMPDRSAGAYGDGIYLSTKKSDAAGYTVKGGVVEAYLPKNIKLFEARSSEPFTVNTKKLIAEGYDGVKIKLPGGAENITIFDPSVVKTKSQLTDIWNKANKK